MYVRTTVRQLARPSHDAVGVATAAFGAAVWIALGDTDTDPLRQARQVLLALAFAVVVAAMCGWRPGRRFAATAISIWRVSAGPCG
jgi:hypothetical protein